MFRPEDFLALAKDLLERSRSEAILRTVISRAYYAAFQHVREHSGRQGIRHSELWREIDRADFDSGHLGDRIRRLRNAADYADPMPDLEEDARWCVGRAEQLICNFGNAQ